MCMVIHPREAETSYTMARCKTENERITQLRRHGVETRGATLPWIYVQEEKRDFCSSFIQVGKLNPNSSAPRPQLTAGGPENHDEITSKPDTKFQNTSVIRSGVRIV